MAVHGRCLRWLVVMCCMLVAGSLAAMPDAEPPETPSLLRVGIEQLDYYPHYDFAGNEPRGFFFELMELFAQTENIHLVYVPLPVRRLYQEADNGIDVVYPDNPNWQRYLPNSTTKYFSEPVTMNLGTTWVVPAQQQIELARFRTLATIRGFTPTKWLELQPQYKYRFVEVADVDAALGLVQKGRVDGAAIEYHVAQHFLHYQPLANQLVVAEQLPYTELPFCLSSTRYPAVISRFNQFQQKHQKEIKALKRKFGLIDSLNRP